MLTGPSAGRVIGPVVDGSHGWAFGCSSTELAAQGYVEEEYFLEREAAQYSLAPDASYRRDGRWDVVSREPSPFKTRFLVRREPILGSEAHRCAVLVLVVPIVRGLTCVVVELHRRLAILIPSIG